MEAELFERVERIVRSGSGPARLSSGSVREVLPSETDFLWPPTGEASVAEETAPPAR
ncbi:hypothetical protein [Streptomyces sp. B1I3]|uniref:hypothetical protein n=1 Tax=Streptomyces sp. B1I3 TaxID=3042264 RepID=UPI002781E399|nr:hypothetical protein [Streptomyces sp. B1I3]MDQ0796578.1 hypothetical protein [Streptomyces sp. B1I3]